MVFKHWVTIGVISLRLGYVIILSLVDLHAKVSELFHRKSAINQRRKLNFQSPHKESWTALIQSWFCQKQSCSVLKISFLNRTVSDKFNTDQLWNRFDQHWKLQNLWNGSLQHWFALGLRSRKNCNLFNWSKIQKFFVPTVALDLTLNNHNGKR